MTILTDEDLNAYVAAPHLVAQYKELRGMLEEEGRKLALAQSIINIQTPRIVKLEDFINRLMWPIYSGWYELSTAVIDDAKKLGWNTGGWKK